jgi:hypothetical protein
MRICKIQLVTWGLVMVSMLARDAGASSVKGTSTEAVTQELADKNFFDQATRSINHDKKVLAKLERHPLAHASGWEIRETQGADKVSFTS